MANDHGPRAEGVRPRMESEVGEALDGQREAVQRGVSVAVLYAVADAMPEVSLEDDETAAVQGGLGSVDLRDDVLAGLVLIDHAVYGLQLSHDLLYPEMEVLRVLAVCHLATSKLQYGGVVFDNWPVFTDFRVTRTGLSVYRTGG